jgi:hypothetical protein
MNELRVAERLIQTIEWPHLRAMRGDGSAIREALECLLSADNHEASRAAYWQIENHAFVQGELFEVAEACTSVLVASLADARPKFVRIAALDLLFNILNGYPSLAPGTPDDILLRCRRSARDGLWLLYREVMRGEREAAIDVLDLLGESQRVAKFCGTT